MPSGSLGFKNKGLIEIGEEPGGQNIYYTYTGILYLEGA